MDRPGVAESQADRPRCAPAPTCWPRPDCSTTGARPPIGEYCEDLAGRYPHVQLDPDPVFLRDGDIWTSAGVTAGMDLALALVEDDLGLRSRWPSRGCWSSSSSAPADSRSSAARSRPSRRSRPALRELQAWIAGHLDGDLSVAALAERANMSERSFTRAFRREVGQTPAAYVETAAHRACACVARGRSAVTGGGGSVGGLCQRRGTAPRFPPSRRRLARRLPRPLPTSRLTPHRVTPRRKRSGPAAHRSPYPYSRSSHDHNHPEPHSRSLGTSPGTTSRWSSRCRSAWPCSASPGRLGVAGISMSELHHDRPR